MKIHGIKVAIFLGVLGFFSLATLFSPKDTSSYYENRMLETAPNFTVSGVLDRSYYTKWESYLSDHIYGRDTFLKNNVAQDMALHRPIVNGTVVTQDTLLPYYKAYWDRYDPEKMERTMELLQQFQEVCKSQEIPFLYVLIPEQSSALRENYPAYLDHGQYKELTLHQDLVAELENIHVDTLDAAQFLSRDYPKFYAQTDHHYNYLGAYETYLHMMDYVDENYFPVTIYDQLELIPVDGTFLGSHNRKIFGAYDTTDVNYDYVSQIPFTRTDNGDVVDDTVFSQENQDTYNYYMGGDKALTVLDTDRPELPTAMVIGDSFSNPLETLLYQSFDKTYSVDLRHTQVDFDLEVYMKETAPDVIFYIRDDITALVCEGNGALLQQALSK